MDATGSSPAADPCCGLCLAERAPYTCPRCHLRFCSVPCYREHGSCAQDFQRRELQILLQGQREDPASQRRLREALLRLQDLREPGDADTQLGLDPSVEQELWEQLSPEQRKCFQRLLNSGEISALLPPWKPWWTGGSRGAVLVQELGEPSETLHTPLQQPAPSQCTGALQRPHTPVPLQETFQSPPQPADASNPVPAVPGVIAPLLSLTRSPVSPLVCFQLPNVLYAYAYSLALYNGDVEEDQLLPEFCETVLDVSGALGAKQGFSSTAEALQAALQAITTGRYPECLLGNAGVMAAVAQILMGECQAKQKGYSLAALAHLSRLLSKGKRRMPVGDQPRLYAAKKKCAFLLSWVNDNEGELTLLAMEVQREYKAHLDAVKEVGAVTQELEKMWGAKVPPPKKPLIEELD
ncbi:zinc finger HIT domain-containing protein 2-like [Eublepharis macularius]|uniref:Zinc finger HIT domain-containing protein 2-like n=1 Tax=Eublepharis macularius TaxID=481883 RepID=A0AA97JZ74_EUBMA|nr:zinc finger HIT domain-containing protein 2-like [Eublepharis macularius]XP_054846918.1 zinc finger HIT domain-containing protein 2-like [Eublepharis macularius]XP_054846927.1 zinc finger HIT domain-containing protein 2-like [Eublepharis macularius]XP_054846932.1 zinc finger HIT domain-containing protein 2-like [Eublepharis macularius]